MTRKDYVRIANAFSKALDDCDSPEEINGVRIAVVEVANALQAENSSFDRPRFLTACGVR